MRLKVAWCGNSSFVCAAHKLRVKPAHVFVFFGMQVLLLHLLCFAACAYHGRHTSMRQKLISGKRRVNIEWKFWEDWNLQRSYLELEIPCATQFRSKFSECREEAPLGEWDCHAPWNFLGSNFERSLLLHKQSTLCYNGPTCIIMFDKSAINRLKKKPSSYSGFGKEGYNCRKWNKYCL